MSACRGREQDSSAGRGGRAKPLCAFALETQPRCRGRSSVPAPGVRAWQETPENAVPGARLRRPRRPQCRGVGLPATPHRGSPGQQMPPDPRLLAGRPRRRRWPGRPILQPSQEPVSGPAPPPPPRGRFPQASCRLSHTLSYTRSGASEKPASQDEFSEPPTHP